MAIKKKLVQLKGSQKKMMVGASELGPRQAEEVVEFIVYLRQRPLNGEKTPSLEELALSLPHQRQTLKGDDLTLLYGASPEDAAKVEQFATKNGFTVVNTHLASRTITLSGPVNKINAILAIDLQEYQHEKNVYRGYTGLVSIPRDLEGIVVGVYGLDNRPIVKRHHSQSEDIPLTNVQWPPAGAFLPNTVAQLYHFPRQATGKGQSIAILEFGGGYDNTVLERYFTQVIGIPMPFIRSVPVYASGKMGGNIPNPTDSACAEVYLDIEIAAAIAPGAEYYVYFAPDFDEAGVIAAINAAVFAPQNSHAIISLSWGLAEEGWGGWLADDVHPINHALLIAAAKGITVCVSSGDHGATCDIPDQKAHVLFPASSPWVLACGGTRLQAMNGMIYKETVWNDGNTWATGGGFSDIFPCPNYQHAAGITPVSANPGSMAGRGVPDVAGLADPQTGLAIYDPSPNVVGGTSAVAPMWAALIALLNEKLALQLGFINPLLYQLGNSNEGFHPITEGNNITQPNTPGYYAGPGWNPCTGWGSPNGEKLLAALYSILHQESETPEKPGPEVWDFEPDEFISHIIKDPAHPGGAIFMQGFIGQSVQEGVLRLYPHYSLAFYYDIRQEDIIYLKKNQGIAGLPVGVMVWLKPHQLKPPCARCS